METKEIILDATPSRKITRPKVALSIETGHQEEKTLSSLSSEAAVTSLSSGVILEHPQANENQREAIMIDIDSDKKSLPSSRISTETFLSRSRIGKLMALYPLRTMFILLICISYEGFMIISPYTDTTWGLLSNTTTISIGVSIVLHMTNRKLYYESWKNFSFLYMCIQTYIAFGLSSIVYPTEGGLINSIAFYLSLIPHAFSFSLATAAMDVCQSMPRIIKLLGFFTLMSILLYFRYGDSSFSSLLPYHKTPYSSVPIVYNHTHVCTIYYSCDTVASVRGSLWGTLAVLAFKNLIFALWYPTSFVLISGRAKIRVRRILVSRDAPITTSRSKLKLNDAYNMIFKSPRNRPVSSQAALSFPSSSSSSLSPTRVTSVGIGVVTTIHTHPVLTGYTYEFNRILNIHVLLQNEKALSISVISFLVCVSSCLLSLLYQSIWLYLICIIASFITTIILLSNADKHLLLQTCRQFDLWYVSLQVIIVWIIFIMYESLPVLESPLVQVLRILSRLSLCIVLPLTTGLDSIPLMISKRKLQIFFLYLSFLTTTRLLLEFIPDLLRLDEICSLFFNCTVPVNIAKNVISPGILFVLRFIVTTVLYPSSPVIIRTRIEWSMDA